MGLGLGLGGAEAASGALMGTATRSRPVRMVREVRSVLVRIRVRLRLRVRVRVRLRLRVSTP